MIIIQGSEESGYKVKDNETITEHLLTCTMIDDTEVQSKTSSWLLNDILFISRTATMIN